MVSPCITILSHPNEVGPPKESELQRLDSEVTRQNPRPVELQMDKVYWRLGTSKELSEA
jgi:hypothetical protein